MTIDEINEELEELSLLEDEVKKTRKQVEMELYNKLVKPKLKIFDEESLELSTKKSSLLKEKKRYYDSYIFDNDYIGSILARLFTECTNDKYEYYRRIPFLYSLYGYNYAEEVFHSSIISCFEPLEGFGKIKQPAFYPKFLDSLICFKEQEAKENGFKLNRVWNPGYIVLDLYASEKIVFKHSSNCYYNDTPERIFSTPYGEFIDELAKRRFCYGEPSSQDLDNMISEFVKKSKTKQMVHH